MRISAKGEYAIRALLDLAVHHGEGLVPIQEVARRQGIPQRYLEQVLLLLKRAGILESRRGSAGGYQLVGTAWDLGGRCSGPSGALTAPDIAGRHPSKTSESDVDLARGDRGAVAAVVDRTTFGDLAEQVKARRSPRDDLPRPGS
jgi:hypothetical protein